MRRVVMALLVAVSSLAAVSCATAPSPVLPANVKWVEPPTLPGAKLAVLDGDPTKPGLTTYRIWFPANSKVAAHWHPVAENVTVVSGTVYLGLGDKLDPAKGTAYSAGSFFTVPANTRHFAWTGADEAVVQVHIVGPTGMTFVNPADDPRKK